MKKKQQQKKETLEGKSDHPIPQDHWEMHTNLRRGNNRNPYDVYFAKPPTEWPQPHKKINESDY